MGEEREREREAVDRQRGLARPSFSLFLRAPDPRQRKRDGETRGSRRGKIARVSHGEFPALSLTRARFFICSQLAHASALLSSHALILILSSRPRTYTSVRIIYIYTYRAVHAHAFAFLFLLFFFDSRALARVAFSLFVISVRLPSSSCFLPLFLSLSASLHTYTTLLQPARKCARERVSEREHVYMWIPRTHVSLSSVLSSPLLRIYIPAREKEGERGRADRPLRRRRPSCIPEPPLHCSVPRGQKVEYLCRTTAAARRNERGAPRERGGRSKAPCALSASERESETKKLPTRERTSASERERGIEYRVGSERESELRKNEGALQVRGSERERE